MSRHQLSLEVENSYQLRWEKAQISHQHRAHVLDIARKIIINKTRYEEIENQSGIPWFVVACIHSLETSLDFRLGLHSGERWNAVTANVPRGRGPFDSFEEAAIDALLIKKRVSDQFLGLWTIPRCLFFLECYNGLGYMIGTGQNTTPPKTSPYLWSMTTIYEKGKYAFDGAFDPELVSKQAGAAAILKGLLVLGETLTENTLEETPKEPPTTHPVLEESNKSNEGEKIEITTPSPQQKPFLKFIALIIEGLKKALKWRFWR